MRQVTMERFGGPEVLEVVHSADPQPRATQVIVQVDAVGVCGHDTADRAGLTRIPTPCVLGHEIAGTVVDVGASVTHIKVGDRVACKQHHTCGWCTACRTGRELDCTQTVFVYGGYADFAVLEEDTLAVLPDQVSMATAAIAACAVGSCVQALDGAANLRPEDTVLITGAGGGLGIHALQVAAARGARVIALTSSSSKIESLRKYGAHEVVLSTDDPVTHLADLTRGRGVDVVLDNVGLPAVFDTGFRSLARRGRYVLTGQLKREKISLYPAFVFFKEAVITGSASTSSKSFLEAIDLVASGSVTGVTTEYPLDQVVDAHRAVESSAVLGRAVLVP
ncbi:alcohol dehydrogenase catalytic domain-containing protein [Rhodococcus sp. NPDC127530]|uniref:alcohol dehydrogenase catalytic domain-containing protein n=1 Tax=unclassified Rhodococcus (in: high G+C Gram-positive bacteria) TaxID=192944 RepID=UPI00363685A5